MSDDIKKIIIVSSCLVVLIGLLVLVLFVDIDLKIIKFNSVKTLLGKHDEVNVAETQLKQKETEYNDAIKKVKDVQTTFDSEKTKYEAISDDTINIINEATTEENYNIEYMWIRLGNYAKSNNLTIIMAEPGGSFDTTTNQNASTSSTNSNSSSSSVTTATTDNTGSSTSTGTTSANSTTSGTNTTTTTNGDASASTTGASTSGNTATSTTDSNTLFKIQVSGSYLDVSDFIFEVENDKALRFRLDNISMDYVSGTTIKASFNVKNLIINK